MTEQRSHVGAPVARGMRDDIGDSALTSVGRNLPGTRQTSVTVVGRAIPAGAASAAIVWYPGLPIALEISVVFPVSISVASFEVWRTTPTAQTSRSGQIRRPDPERSDRPAISPHRRRRLTRRLGCRFGHA